MMNFRLIPLVMIASLTLLGSKVITLAFGSGPNLFASAAQAEEKPDAEAADAGSNGEIPVSDVRSSESETSLGQGDNPAAAPSDRSSVPQVGLASPAEYAILQDLAARRQQLDDRERAMMLRSQMIGVAEKRLEDRIQELKRIEQAVAGALRQIDEQEEAQILSLVKIYESMKPKSAAGIFEELEMETLIEVASRMRETKVATVLAKMRPDAAKSLTEALASRVERPELNAPTTPEEDPQG